MYKDHLRYFVNRVNTITGIVYRDDPTIFAWNRAHYPQQGFPSVQKRKRRQIRPPLQLFV